MKIMHMASAVIVSIFAAMITRITVMNSHKSPCGGSSFDLHIAVLLSEATPTAAGAAVAHPDIQDGTLKSVRLDRSDIGHRIGAGSHGVTIDSVDEACEPSTISGGETKLFLDGLHRYR
ncbi:MULTISPECIES: hypothetical protein [Bifidobacterium]|uniref:hypothetical protein n=1 Tax=Bifidobacterium TaxID=1678 RepID=UPI001BDD400C|nr:MULTISPECIES: hypothetical protein [Bifidobacterium]MBT1162908.1 hypothetical protein [Bifidobacterium sp. SO1]MBW3077905.1 hypothetical protein [Bifidobacterium simiiventris]